MNSFAEVKEVMKEGDWKAEIEADQEKQPTWDYSVKDIVAFVCAYPQFCKVEVKREEFLAALNSDFFTASRFPEEIPLSPGMPPHPPGIEVFAQKKIK